jgi:hypothetical protein
MFLKIKIINFKSNQLLDQCHDIGTISNLCETSIAPRSKPPNKIFNL